MTPMSLPAPALDLCSWNRIAAEDDAIPEWVAVSRAAERHTVPKCLSEYHAGVVCFCDDVPLPVALLGPCGHLLHANAPLVEFLNSNPESTCIVSGLRHVALRVHRTARGYRCETAGSRLHGRAIGPVSRDACATIVAVTVHAPRTSHTLHQLQQEYRLTPRELDIAILIGEGRSTKSIAAALSISWHTARGHIERTMKKLRVQSRAQAAAAVTSALRPPPGIVSIVEQ
jgi:DNA-binding CsgD family transcriptional regulator